MRLWDMLNQELRIKEVELDLKILKLKFEPEVLEATLADLVTEMRKIVSALRVDERDILRKIMAHPSGSLLVTDIFTSFKRGTEKHQTLRRLRDAQFIRPAEGGPWEAHKHIEIKAFGKVMWDKIGEQKLFA
jgi:hypothetical protein